MGEILYPPEGLRLPDAAVFLCPSNIGGRFPILIDLCQIKILLTNIACQYMNNILDNLSRPRP
ncbi:hypothetical protein D1AOALGA4SA_6798 [Olavius algarvensis Delta 1 endosymbiont]|nr:hypothetical protein D1AOALGA4SA_6798 [Olavius algarvensis Delta 1 endosymbiont]